MYDTYKQQRHIKKKLPTHQKTKPEPALTYDTSHLAPATLFQLKTKINTHFSPSAEGNKKIFLFFIAQKTKTLNTYYLIDTYNMYNTYYMHNTTLF